MVILLALTFLHGTVRIGPTMPVCVAAARCDAPASHVQLTFTHGAQRVQTTTDRLGHYTVKLAPGTWTVKASVGVFTMPRAFVVPHAASARRDFSIDTGIR